MELPSKTIIASDQVSTEAGQAPNAPRPGWHESGLTIVFTALAVSRTVQDRSGLSIRKVMRHLRPLRSATITINGATRTFDAFIDDPTRDIINAITNAGPGH